MGNQENLKKSRMERPGGETLRVAGPLGIKQIKLERRLENNRRVKMKDHKGIHERLTQQEFDFRSGWEEKIEVASGIWFAAGLLVGAATVYVLIGLGV